MKSDTIKVKGGPHGPVFLEGMRRELDADGKDKHVIREGETREVPNTRYYRKRIEAGDLVIETAAAKKKEK